MAKGQKRSSRELKKPKAKKSAPPGPTAQFAKAELVSIGTSKRK
jgi:hypothetical protein